MSNYKLMNNLYSETIYSLYWNAKISNRTVGGKKRQYILYAKLANQKG